MYPREPTEGWLADMAGPATATLTISRSGDERVKCAYKKTCRQAMVIIIISNIIHPAICTACTELVTAILKLFFLGNQHIW